MRPGNVTLAPSVNVTASDSDLPESVTGIEICFGICPSLASAEHQAIHPSVLSEVTEALLQQTVCAGSGLLV